MKRVVMRTVCLFLACLAVADAAAQGEPGSQPASVPTEHLVSGQSPVFTLRVPGTFKPASPADAGVTHSFVLERGQTRILLDLIPYFADFRGRPIEKTFDVPADRTVELPWQDTAVTVYEIPRLTTDGHEVVLLIAAVPTAGNGLVVRLAGPREALGEMEQLLPTLLAGLDAQASQAQPRSDLFRKATALSILGMLIIIITLRRHQRMRKRSEQADEARRRAAWGDGPSE
ncbi:MAG: hypothetical protein FWE88_02505 [Phycisphaerae bacterium]|nr:hypothetical protein [Phycisphaerae bacterium]